MSWFIVVLRRAIPDVAVAYASAMILYLQWAGRRVRAIRGYPPVLSGAQEGGVVVCYDAIVQQCDIGRADQLLAVKMGGAVQRIS
jgi:hypothetical protein